MVASKLTFHVPPDASPEQVLLMIERLAEEPDHRFSSTRELLEFSEVWNIDDRSEIPSLAIALGLLDRNGGEIGISKTGLNLQFLKAQVRSDVVHFMLYSGWTPDDPALNTFMWSYLTVCNYLWEHAPLDILQATPMLVEAVIAQSEHVFAGVPGYYTGSVSFSDKSIRGIRKWLDQLRPPVFQGDMFVRRHFCPPELLLLALGDVAIKTGGELGIDFLLTSARRDLLCRTCLLDPSAFDRALDWMLPLYPAIVEPGTRTGAYGRFIRIHRTPQLGDLAS